jgi:mono/diheme cytochrome c family protein
LAAKDIITDGGETLAAAAGRQVEMSPNSYAKQCGVCHAGGGQLEYDRDMNQYGSGSASGDRYTWLNVAVNGSTTVNGRIVDIAADPTIQSTSLYGDNKTEVDCLLCHMDSIRPAAAYYKNTLGCSDTNMTGPADNPNCGSQKVVFMDMTTGTPMMMPDNRFNFSIGDFYDSYNRNIALSLGYFKQSASAGLGAGVNLADGAISGMPTTLAGSKISAVPNSANCAQCHARTESDNIGLPGEAQVFGGMIAGYGNFVRLTDIDKAFDWDKIAADGSCTTGCTNETKWMEFGCKTGMGKRSQKAGTGSSDRYGNGFCLICDSQNQWNNPQSFCALPSVQASCIAKTGIGNLITDGSPMTLVDFMPDGTPMPKLIPGKMPDTDVHDASSQGIKCGTCHYAMSGSVPARTISGNGATYTYPATTLEKMDHNLAKGFSMLEKGGDGYEGTVSCASCHTTRTHPALAGNGGTLASPQPGHMGFPALHFEKIDCRTCHIPTVYSSPGRLLFRDWTAGAYRQTEGSNGNANHFDFAMNLLEGSMAPMAPMKSWVTTPEGTMITPILPSLLPIWTGSAIRASDNMVLGWSPARTRDITAAAAVIAAANRADGNSWDLRLNGTNDHPPFQGFQLTDPMKIESKEKIDAMAAELGTARSGVAASHGTVRDPRISLYPTFFDPSHGVPSTEWALGSPAKGGCLMCHSSSNPSSPSYSPYSVGFFDSEKELLQNGMMQMANADCDNPYLFNMMTTGDPYAGTAPTCIETTPPPAGTGLCDGTARGTTSTGAMNGTLGLCKQQIGGMLAQQMGMTPDSMMRMDGVEFMQMMAIREGMSAPHAGSPNGCNPMMQIFGLPTGCTGAEYYSRSEIKLHFAKNLQQSTFNPVVAGSTWTNPITGVTGPVPATMNRVFGIISVGKNPGNPNHANKFDLGATCYNPLDMTHTQTFPCGDPAMGMNMIKTFVKANEFLGYDQTRLAGLLNLSLIQYTISASAGPNGAITPSGDVSVPSGSNGQFDITPAAGYRVADVVVDGASVGARTSYTFYDVIANHTISATFAQDSYTITAVADANGSITPSGTLTINGGASQAFTITPAAGFEVLSVIVDGANMGAVTTYTFTNVSASHTIDVYFKQITYTILTTAGAGGSISPVGPRTLNIGASVTFTMTPAAGYHINDVLVDGASVGSVATYTFTNVTANHTITATFAANSSYAITASAVGNGTISPSGTVNVLSGANKKFTFTPAAGYRVADVTVDGASVGVRTSYTFYSVQAVHTISAPFCSMSIPSRPQPM